MIKLFDRNPIQKAFSDAALQYDVLTSMHKEIGRELTGKLADIEGISSILDIGMGTGWFTNRLTNSFPEAKVIGLDFAPGMIDCAKNQNEGFEIVQAHARALPFKEKTFDLIVSNLAYQWVEDLPRAFNLCYSTLKENGVFCFTMFGRNTCKELFLCLENSSDKKAAERTLPIRKLASKTQVVEAIYGEGFKEVEEDDEQIKVHFPDMMALIKWIKDIGANTLERDVYMGKDLLTRAGDYYDKNFRDRLGIYATFEVIWVKAKK